MATDKTFIEALIYKRFQATIRFTQDSPVYPDVWMGYFDRGGESLTTYRMDLILTPHRRSSAGELFQLVAKRLGKKNAGNVWAMATSGNSVVARLTFTELIDAVLPLSGWW